MVLESILQTDISDYRKTRSKYHEKMHSMYGIIYDNIDHNIITLLEADPSYAEISIEYDPIELISSFARCVARKKVMYMHLTHSFTLLLSYLHASMAITS